MLGLPLVAIYLWICVHHYRGALALPTSVDEWRALIALVPSPTWEAAGIFFAWLVFQALLQAYLPGKRVQGQPMADGRRLTYRMNGLLAFILTYALLALGVWLGWWKATLAYDHFGPLLVVANLFAFGMAIFLFLHARLARVPGPATGHLLVDFFLGAGLNPRLGSFDLKLFFEARPGLIGWTVIVCSLAAAQLEQQGSLSTPMLLVVAFQVIYVLDYFVFEDAILTTLDVMHDGFGWMLCWGDIVWVPFVYCLQAYYLLVQPVDLPPWAVAGVIALNLAGFVLFRWANLQKHTFRRHPDRPIWGQPPAVIATRNGAGLLVSGFWGVARHLNYTGDLMMALAWGLACGFGSILPYFYFLYFTVLLVHREWRDNKRCAARHGQAWQAYTQRVRWRFIPWLY